MSLRATTAGFGALVRVGRDARALAPARRKAALAKVRGLSAAESAPLLALPAERVAVYHDLVVGGHRTMLRYALGTTLAALDLVRAERPKLARREDLDDAVRAFLAAAGGPRTHSLRELASTFLRFLKRREARAFKAYPALGELARCELAELAVELETDGPGRFATEADLARLAAGTFDRFLKTRVRKPSYARVLAFRCDAPALLKALRADPTTATLADLARPARTYAALVRSPSDLLPRRHDWDAATYRDYRAAPADAAFRIEDLAALRARRGPRGETEETAAGRVASEILGWLRSGVLLLA